MLDETSGIILFVLDFIIASISRTIRTISFSVSLLELFSLEYRHERKRLLSIIQHFSHNEMSDLVD